MSFCIKKKFSLGHTAPHNLSMQQRLFRVVQSLLLSFSTSRQPIYLVSTFARTLTTHDRNVATSLNAVPVDDLPRVLLKRNRQSKSFRDGNQLVFSGSIEKISSSSSLKSGHIVQVEVPHKAGGETLPIQITRLLNSKRKLSAGVYTIQILCIE